MNPVSSKKHIFRGGIQPFWFWNSGIRDEETVFQIREMKEKGVNGFFLHPRQGLKVPYLSSEWFDRVETAVQTAADLDMDVWLYDEFPYPSGNAGGLILAERPDLAARMINPFIADAEGGALSLAYPLGKVLSAQAVPLVEGRLLFDRSLDLAPFLGVSSSASLYQETGLTKYNRKRYFGKNDGLVLHSSLPAGSWKICVFIETLLDRQKYFGQFADPLHPDTVSLFLSLTHEACERRLSRWFGTTIKGFFSDETDLLPHGMSLRWSSLFPGYFEKEKGYSLLPHLARLYLDDTPGGPSPETLSIREDYTQAIADAFIRNWDSRIGSWCRERGLLYAAEKPVLRFSQLDHIDVPGIDAGHSRVFDGPELPDSHGRSNAVMAASAARFNGRRDALCECFHSIGWGMTLEDARWMMDILALQGISLFVLHAFFYSTDGLRKHDAPPSQFFQMPWWKHFGHLSRHTEELREVLSQGEREAPVLVLDPSEDIRSSLGDAGRQQGSRLADLYGRIQKALLLDHLEFDIAGREIFRGIHQSTEDSSSGRFSFRGYTYKALVLMQGLRLSDSQEKQLRTLEESGVSIVFCSDLSRGESSPEEMPRFLRSQGIGTFLIEGEIPGLLAVARRCEHGSSAVLVNTGPDPLSGILRFLPDPFPRKGRGSLSFSLAPYETRVLKQGEQEDTRQDSLPSLQEIVIDSTTPAEIRLAGLNSLRMGRWVLSVSEGDHRTQQAAVACKPLINQLEEGGFSFTPVYKRAFGCPAALQLPEFHCSYTYSFILDEKVLEDAAPVYLLMERTSLESPFQLELNGYSLDQSSRMKFPGWPGGIEAFPLKEFLHSGENTCSLTLRTDSPSGGLVNPLYLHGLFSVYPGTGEMPRLGLMEQKGFFHDPISSGFPSFAGEIEYTVTLPPARDERVLVLRDFHDAVELFLRGESQGVRCWSPYRWTLPASPSAPQRVVLKVATTLLGLFEGQYAHPLTGGYLPLDS